MYLATVPPPPASVLPSSAICQNDAVVVEQLADAAHDLGRGVGRAGLAARAGVLAKAHAVVDIGGVALIVHARQKFGS